MATNSDLALFSNLAREHSPLSGIADSAPSDLVSRP
jgi:hypothetical protein